MANRIRLDSAGIAAMLKSAPVAGAVGDLADSVASNLRADDAVVRNGLSDDVTVLRGQTDRANATVVLAHPSAMPIEAKHGSLSKAAAAAGLEVKARGE